MRTMLDVTDRCCRNSMTKEKVIFRTSSALSIPVGVPRDPRVLRYGDNADYHLQQDEIAFRNKEKRPSQRLISALEKVITWHNVGKK